MPIVLPQISAGKFKVFAVTVQKRFDGAPAVPTAMNLASRVWKQSSGWDCSHRQERRATIVEKINHDTVEILRTPALRDILRVAGRHIRTWNAG